MAPLDPEAEHAIRKLLAEALSQAGALPRPPRRGRPSKDAREALSATGGVAWSDDGRLLLEPREAMAALGIRRTKLHALVRSGALRPRYLGRLQRFLRADLAAFVAALPTTPE